MKRACAVGLAFVMFAAAPWARGQGSLGYLEQELDDLRQKHDAAANKGLQYFFTSLEQAQSDPQAADKLYMAAGGKAPDGAKVITAYEHETPSEAEARGNVDKAARDSLDGALQLQCGLMRFAALFITAPNTPGLDQQFADWLKEAAQLYPAVTGAVSDPRRKDQGPVDVSGPIRGMSVRDSPIAGFLGFHNWNGKDQGGWRVADLPELYRQRILEPLRQKPTQDTLAAWNVYMTMMNASQPNPDQWTNVDYPALQFQKMCDDFAVEPDPEKIEGLIALIKEHPDHPNIESWFDTVHGLIQGMAKKTETASAPASTTSPALPPILPDPPTRPSVGP